jgi:CRP/FNR family transcriptional regulator, cyclic AMP receptor protein
MNQVARTFSLHRQESVSSGPLPFPEWLDTGGDGTLGNLCLPVKSVAKNAVVCRQGERLDSVYFVQRGSVSLTRLAPDGRESLFSIATLGEFFGETALLNGSVASFNAVALEKSTLLELSRSKFLRMLEMPEVSRRFLTAMARRCNDAWMQMEAMSCARVEDKIRSVLLWLCGRSTHLSPSGVRISLNQTQLACMVGCARETLARNIAVLRRNGVVAVRCERGRKVLYVVNSQALSATM